MASDTVSIRFFPDMKIRCEIPTQLRKQNREANATPIGSRARNAKTIAINRIPANRFRNVNLINAIS